ncbi:hypothetical protein [Jutongia huaianensis]|jgi:hypothetical protein|uniref:Uncharacterized protein n=1 Tax=Jutongia huaianensis TaxID=2763668 RepID=A0ABR7N2M3_9FIRM|nr:hypothetical protein [Jutongia huaianensis]MBC8562870.1 hypothetical protein [Jutongia huaianensis]OKZ83685.1 MAG: hypothetical protein BHW06_05660 [Clostridium sp. 44_14]
MKIVKRLLIFLLCIVMAGGILFLISIPRVNDHIAKHTMTELAQVPMPEQTKCIEKVSAAGKLSGNGNGMQYLGALLVKSNLSLKDLKKYYAANTPRKWYCDVERQKGQSLRASEHVELGFKHTVKGKNYYAVYAWGDYDGIYSELDLRGH